MDPIEGGALLPISDFFVGNGRTSHTVQQSGRPIAQADLDATNALQETGWRVNGDVLAVAQQAFATGHPAIGVDGWSTPTIPPRLRDAEFAALDPEGRRRVAIERKEAREAAEVWRSGLRSVAALLDGAEADKTHGSLYVAYGHDSRLRRYPRLSSGPNPQGDGLSRALIMFDRGEALGSRGIFWLAVRAGTAAGLDKLDHSARAAWASENTQAILQSAKDPFGTDFWWKDRDDPWALLATCMEFGRAFAGSDVGAFQSHLPVNVDGTCNGLQHLSALGLDPVGALATNLTASPDRNDIYETVAAVVRARVQSDADNGLDVAKGWIGKVGRDTVKRGCMTTAYGVTARGMRDQLVNDGHVATEDHEDVSAAAGYLRDVMWVAIGEVVVAARNIMDWLQTVAARLAERNIPFTWQTPTGSTIQQAYRPWTTTRPLTAFGRLHVAGAIDKSALKVRKQALAAAPNFVHSFDAAHMALTINSGRAAGITHWATIHDSYGTHAARVDTMNKVLRNEFVGIYGTDWLQRTYERACKDGRGVEVPPPPARSDFDITQVRDSTWFFA